ncbi:MAG: hypothetical protein ACI9S8_003221 [Chlamydiales bacterium]|jgi:hypothetical protein
MEGIEDVMETFNSKMGIGLVLSAHSGFTVKYPNQIDVNIESDEAGNRFLICSELPTVPGGPYRNNLLMAALKTNGLPSPRHGTLAFSPQGDIIIMFEYLYLRGLDSEDMFLYVSEFAKKAKLWSDAIKNGDIPQVVGDVFQSDNLFGIR